MPAQSKAQQRFMGMVHAAQQGEEPASPEVAKVAKDMKKSDAKDFASTKHKGLPNHVKQEILNRLKEYALTLPNHNIKPAAPAQSLDDLEGVNESWTVKDGSVLSNGKLIGYYDFDRDSDSFWVDDVKKGKGQLSFDTKKEVEDYFKKNEKDAVKHLGKLRESTTPSDIIKDLDKVRTDLIKKVDVLIAKKKKLYSNVDIESPMSADEKQLDKDIQSIFSQIQSLIQQKRKIKNESISEESEGLWANIRAKRARGEKPSPKNSKAYKDAVKAGKEINKNESVNETMNPREDALLKTFKNIVDTHSSLKIKDGGKTTLIDVQSANAVLKLYDALSDVNKKSLFKMPIDKMIKTAWHVLGKK